MAFLWAFGCLCKTVDQLHSCSNVTGNCSPHSPWVSSPLISRSYTYHPPPHTHTILTIHYFQPKGGELVNMQILVEIGSTLKPFQSRFSCQFFGAGRFKSRYLERLCLVSTLEGERLRQRSGIRSTPRIHPVRESGERKCLQSHASLIQTQHAAAFEIFAVGSR